ncbi:MAG: PAS domain S-box protein [Nitrospiria bacterium]
MSSKGKTGMGLPLRLLIVGNPNHDTAPLALELKEGGYDLTVEQVETGDAMCAALDRKEWDVILADNAMPDLSASAALQLVKEKGRDIPFIIMSDIRGEDAAVAAMKGGAHDYIVRGNLKRLVPAVERELREASLRREQRQAEESVRKSEQRFRMEREKFDEKFHEVLEFVPDAMVVVGQDGRIVFVNAQTERLFGYRRDELVGNPLGILLPDRLREVHQQHFTHYLSDPTIRPMGGGIELVGRHQDGGEVPVEISLSPLHTDEGILAMSAIRDITERKKAKDAMEALNRDLERRVTARTAQLEASNKELEAFSYSVSHDLRTPLRAINGFSRVLLEESADRLDAEGKGHLRRVCAASERMGQLIDDILNLSRVSRSQVSSQAVNLSALVKAIAAGLQKGEPERTVEFQIAEGAMVNGDRRLLRVVLVNLLNNAWKFTKNRPQAKIEFGVTNHSGKPAYYVRDNGAGFDMAYADKLFGAFQRLHGATEFPGSGIGLATVQRIIHRHGGRIWAEGAVDQGATFYFTL